MRFTTAENNLHKALENYILIPEGDTKRKAKAYKKMMLALAVWGRFMSVTDEPLQAFITSIEKLP